MKLSQARTQLWILYAALVAALLVYGVVAVVVKPPALAVGGGPAPAEADPAQAAAAAPDAGLFLPLFAGISAVELFVVMPIVRRRLMPRRESSPHPLELDDLDEPRVDDAIARLRTASIVTWALAESVALFGLVAAFILREPLHYAPFAAVAAIVMLVYAPRRRLVDEVVRAARAGQGTPG